MMPGGENTIPPMNFSAPISSADIFVPPSASSAAVAAKKPQPWAPDAGACYSMGSNNQVEVRLTGGLRWGAFDAGVIARAFGLVSEFQDQPTERDDARIHSGKNASILCLSSGGPVSDRTLIEDMEKRCVPVLLDQTTVSREAAIKKCDALISVLEYTAAPPAAVETSYEVTHHPLFWPISIGGGVTLGGFGFGLGMHLFDLTLKERITRLFRRGKGPDDKDPPAPAGGMPGAASASSNVFTGAAHFAASYALAKAGELKHFVTDTTAGKLALGAAIGIGILATAPVSMPTIIGGGALYGSSAAMFSLVDGNLLRNGGLGPREA